MLLSSVPAITVGAGEHSRRAGAELVVLAGDLAKLADGAVPELQQRGLRERILGSLSGLPFLLRLAAQENGRAGRFTGQVKQLRQLLETESWSQLVVSVSTLSQEFPFPARGILPATPTPLRLRRAEQHHTKLCAACHDTPNLQQERPPFNLFQQSRQMPVREFAARMVVGIRGDRFIGLENPFSDEELAGLIAYYRSSED